MISKKYNKRFIAWIILIIISVVLISLNIDKRIIAIVSIVIGWLTNAFLGASTIIATIPLVGPIIVKLVSIPFFWLMNGIGFFSSAYAIKRGETQLALTHRLVSVVLVVGIIIGYVLAHLTYK